MPAILSIVVLLIVFYCFWLFVRTATPYQMGRVLAVLAIGIGIAALALLAMTGRLPVALLILIVLWPFMAGYFNLQRKKLLTRYQSRPDANGQKKDQTKNDFDQSS